MRGVVVGCVLLLVLPVVLLGVAVLAAVQQEDSPVGQGAAGLVCGARDASGAVAGYAGEQLDNAAAIVAAGKQRQVPQKAWVIAVATAMQESTLVNVNHGDTAGPDSRGLFQQRASWGPERVRMNPAGAAHLFYDRLVQVPGWESMPITEAAQTVQVSAFPDAYAQHEQDARAVVGTVLGRDCDQTQQQASEQVQQVLDRALHEVGTPYAWGGGTAQGPSAGHGPDAGVTGYDCSGLVLYAYAGVGVDLPHQTQAIYQQYADSLITERQQLQRGDLVLLSSDGSPGGIHHVGLYLGDGAVVEAPASGQTVHVREDIWQSGSNYSEEFLGAVRPLQQTGGGSDAA